MSLDITNESILIEKSHRWQKVCIDIDVWNQEKKVDKNRFNNWTEIKFTETNLSLMEKMRGKEGIYMFVVKPNMPFTCYHSYILYVGETNDLYRRYQNYLRYKDSTHPSDLKKRIMTLVWKDFLYFNFFETDYGSTTEREKEEYDLIDSIVPPMNDDFRSIVLKQNIKLYRR